MRQLFDKIKLRFRTEAVSTLVAKIRVNKQLKHDIAYLRSILYHLWNLLFVQYCNLILFICLLISISYSIFSFQSELESYFSSKDKLSVLSSLLLTLGGALIGAAAIAFTLIMFVMQVNVERMPHGLFHKFSTDVHLKWYFVFIFAFDIAVMSASLIVNESLVAYVILATACSTVLVILLFFKAYKRALLLINPAQQLKSMVRIADRNLKAWDKYATRMESIYGHDRMGLFVMHQNWSSDAVQTIQYAMSIAIRYAGQGDHEVSESALAAAVRINQHYIKAKGKAFFSGNLLLNHHLVSDRFINETLGSFRKAVKTGVSIGDEQFIEQNFIAMEELVEVYLTIDYCDRGGSKLHAGLAAAYLSDAVVSVIPHDMVDVLMEGTRLIGQSSQRLLIDQDPTSVCSAVESIYTIANSGIENCKYRQILLDAMKQLSSLTYNLIRVSECDIRLPASKINDSTTMVVKKFLNSIDEPSSQIPDMYLGPYYSNNDARSLSFLLSRLADAINDNVPEHVDYSKNVIKRFEIWAEVVCGTEKELLLLAIDKRSSFTFDIINWIETVADILMKVSNFDACDDITDEMLQRHARRIIGALSFIPNDRDTATFVERYKLTVTFFEAAMKAHEQQCYDISKMLQGFLLDWGFKAGRHNTGFAILENSLYGLATLALTTDTPTPEGLKVQIKNILSQPDKPDKETLEEAARVVRRTAATLRSDGICYSEIEDQMLKVDNARVQSLLNEVADLISPKKVDNLKKLNGLPLKKEGKKIKDKKAK
jgi:hypothetical protein